MTHLPYHCYGYCSLSYPLLGLPSLKFSCFSVYEMVFPQDICYVVQFHWLKYDPLGYATYMLWHHWFQLEMTKMLHHCMCFWPLILCSWFFCPVLWESLLKGIKSIRIFQVCMLKLSPLSKFLQADGGKSCGVCAFLNKKQCQHLQYKPISYNSHHRVQVMGHFEREIFLTAGSIASISVHN